MVIPPSVQLIAIGHNATLKLTIFSSTGDWVEHFVQFDMQGADGLSVDEIGARYVVPALNILAHRIIAYREPLV